MSIDRDYPFSFEGSKCEGCGGRCCTGESGYVFVSVYEMRCIAAHLALGFESFCLQYVRKVESRFSLLEKPHKSGLACVFYEEGTGKCSIYAVRPKQCVSFPFWESHKTLDSQALSALQKECVGICIKKDNK
ncbi:YkgJ family cysteine cluster protein [Helicobacter marmotae]|uniref:YkgJ family cysteine cluster protein n=2 Tax=Helicobacter marmotae TaxID=152490 RepID=A0A3D8I3Q9_9HELI|nr:YkgJ family cysteine cluster protein [Helicobacter marmotae]RDU59767.1 YkgJ family cysteine cluster protein [Helicobacter marmotae]